MAKQVTRWQAEDGAWHDEEIEALRSDVAYLSKLNAQLRRNAEAREYQDRTRELSERTMDEGHQ